MHKNIVIKSRNAYFCEDVLSKKDRYETSSIKRTFEIKIMRIKIMKKLDVANVLEFKKKLVKIL